MYVALFINFLHSAELIIHVSLRSIKNLILRSLFYLHNLYVNIKKIEFKDLQCVLINSNENIDTNLQPFPDENIFFQFCSHNLTYSLNQQFSFLPRTFKC